jgi:surface antigen
VCVDALRMRRSSAALSTLLAAVLVTPLATPASAAGNDYPYRGDAVSRSDKWGFTTRQCVSFVAWRLAQKHRPLSNATQKWGNAGHWDETARARKVVVTTKPKVGAVAHWNPHEKSRFYPSGGGTGTLTAGAVGHVAYVAAVHSDGSVRIEQYNLSGNRSYSVMRVKAPRYLYLGG